MATMYSIEYLYSFLLFFCFQAEDGIRDIGVTGVQTCALPIWYALANSMNLPTVDLYFKVGRDKLMNTLSKLEFPEPTNNAPSIALGTLDLSLSEVVRAYAAFANQGQLNELVMINKITDAKGKVLYKREDARPEKVFSRETTQMITAI